MTRAPRPQFVAAISFAALAAASPALAQFDPPAGLWGTDDPRDVRVMTWNVEDGVNSAEHKGEGANQWTALAVIVAAMKPDVLVLQEAGDKPGGVDTVGELETTVDLFLHGGFDPFNGEPVGAFVQKYDPGFDLAHVFVSEESDGFNRNVILSRYGFADLNGDTRATISDIPFVFPHEYAEGGDGGIRGFMFAEIDLPGAEYAGDLVVGNAHLKAGFGGDDHEQRVAAASNVAYYVDHLFNGAGAGVPDPHDKILDSPPATTILGDDTPVVLAGDWNEDEGANGTKGPAQWLRVAGMVGGSDGTDRDRTDSELDGAAEPFTGDQGTLGSSKLDYACVQDSIAEVRHAWVFDTGQTPQEVMPAELLEFPSFPGLASGIASDHLPVLVDVILPSAGDDTAPAPFALLSPAPDEQGVVTAPTLAWEAAEGADSYDAVIGADEELEQAVWSGAGLETTTVDVPPDTLGACQTYYWGVVAVNEHGATQSTPYGAAFHTVAAADANQDGVLNILDFVAFQDLFEAGGC